jgi:hypothetical protein
VERVLNHIFPSEIYYYYFIIYSVIINPGMIIRILNFLHLNIKRIKFICVLNADSSVIKCR